MSYEMRDVECGIRIGEGLQIPTKLGFGVRVGNNRYSLAVQVQVVKLLRSCYGNAEKFGYSAKLRSLRLGWCV